MPFFVAEVAKGKLGMIGHEWPEASREVCFALQTILMLEKIARDIGYNFWNVRYGELPVMRELVGWLLVVSITT